MFSSTIRFDGMLRVVRFNWPMYAAAFGGAFIFGLFAFLPTGSRHGKKSSLCFLAKLSSISIGLGILGQTIASLAASHWIYDRSAFKDWHWLQEKITGVRPRIINVHSGYDESTKHMLDNFPTADITVIDLYPALGHRERSIMRARALYPPLIESSITTIDNWPIAEASVDCILIAFAAHELRERKQKIQLFKQAKTVLKPGGKILLVEHLRDWPNFAAFSFGFRHFFSRQEWLHCAREAGLILDRQESITPFVKVFTLCR